MRLGEDSTITPGADDTFMSYGLPWANASNTPFRLFKHFVHEGGIASPAIISWPAHLKSARISHEPCHVQDVLPTFLDLANITMPTNSGVQTPVGESISSIIFNEAWKRDLPICFEHEGNSAIRKGKWKAVRQHPGKWELYDMEQDRTELVNLCNIHPKILHTLITEYEDWASVSEVRSWPPGNWPSWMSNDEFRKG